MRLRVALAAEDLAADRDQINRLGGVIMSALGDEADAGVSFACTPTAPFESMPSLRKGVLFYGEHRP